MPNPWDRLSPEVQAELQSYAGYAGNTASEIKQAALGHAAQAYAEMGNAYVGFISGRNMPPTPTPTTMETTTHTSEPLTAPPESYGTALLKHAAAEGAEHEAEHWRQYAGRETGNDLGAGSGPEGWETFNASAHATPQTATRAAEATDAPTESWEQFHQSAHAEPGAQGFYGVGPPAQDTQPTQDTTQPEQDSYGPEL